jgi:hypothetical protein
VRGSLDGMIVVALVVAVGLVASDLLDLAQRPASKR